MAGEAGKGSKQRPIETDWESFSYNWDTIFNKKTRREIEKEIQDDKDFYSYRYVPNSDDKR